MENFSPLEKEACIQAYKEGFFEKLSQASKGGFAAGIFPAMADIAMWLPPAAITGGALLGSTTAFALAPFEAQKVQQEREMARMKKLMDKAKTARLDRARRQALQDSMALKAYGAL